MKRDYVDTPDGQLHFRTEGSGKALLLLHCATISSDEFSEVIPILGKSYWAIAVDLPGYGLSDKLPYKYSIEKCAHSIVRFMDALDITKANIMGNGSGASIAGEIAISHPERVDNLILSSCPYYTPEVREVRLKDPRFHPMEIKVDGSHIMKAWEYLSNYVPRSRPESWHRVVVNYLLSGVNAEDAHQAVFRYEMEKRLPLIKQRTLLISGTDDVYYNTLEITKSLIPQCRVRLVEGGGVGGSLIKWERPEEFSKIILEFLANPKV